MRCVALHAAFSEPCIGREVFIGDEPVLKRTGGQRHTVALFDVLACCLGRVSSVVVGERGDDDADWIACAFSTLWGKHSGAVVTVPELDGLVLFCAPAFLDDMAAGAVGAAFLVGTDEAGYALLSHGDVIDFVQS